MFKKYFSALNLVKNLAKIKEVVGATYVALVKSIAALQYLQSNLGDTKLGVLLDQYVPKVIAVLIKVKDIILKYGKYIGFEAPVEVASKDILDDLDASFKKLDSLLK